MKKTRRILIALALTGFLVTPIMDAFGDPLIRVDARVEIRPQPRDLQVWIWPDRGEGSYYFPGESIYLNVEVTRDCFLVLYDIDTRGHLRILFPYDPWDDNFVRAGDVVTFPRPQDGYEWTIEGPAGTEYIQAIATEFPMPLPDWPVYLRSVNHGGAVHHDKSLRDFRGGSDRMEYIRTVNRKITGRYWDWCATDLASFHVRRPHWRPRPHVYDPWPEIFYGEIYIGWPIGGRIYIDDIYIGIAPLWIPRHKHGRHRITCYNGNRLVRTQNVHFYPKGDFKFRDRHYRTRDVYADGHVKRARRGGDDHFEFNKRDYRKKDRLDRQQARREHTLRTDRVRDRKDDRIDRRSRSDRRTQKDSKLDRAPGHDKHKSGKKAKKSGWLKSIASSVATIAGRATGVSKRSKGDKKSSTKATSGKTIEKKDAVKQKKVSKTKEKAKVSKSRSRTTGKKKR